jgi:uncharacterized protein (DUF1778 family)
MAASERLDLKLSKQDKELFTRAAALEGTSVAAFLRAAAKDRAYEAIERETRLTLSTRDFAAFNAALEQAFKPNEALERALKKAGKAIRRA